MITNQNKVIDNMTRKLASNDKILETINKRMDSFTSTVKNQLSFNKMIESQISQLAASVPVMEKGKILGKLEDLETMNLIDIYNAGHFYTAPSRAWVDNTLLVKKGDLGRPIIPISIRTYTFEEAVCDLGSSVNIMPKVIYEKIHGEPLLYTTICLQLADQTLCYPKRILEDVSIQVGHSFVPVDFVVVKTGGDDRAPIILGRPFLSTAKAIIYMDSAKICFTINDSKERFNFMKRTLKTPTHP
jgi:hypothetical protein